MPRPTGRCDACRNAPGSRRIDVPAVECPSRARISGNVAPDCVGGIVGYAFGAYRARTTYVAAVPAHKGVILRYSLESFAALGLLIVIKLVAEQNLLPDGDILRTIIAALLGFLLVETFARVITLLRCYRRDETAAAAVTQPAGA
jgi:hypothetical protein